MIGLSGVEATVFCLTASAGLGVVLTPLSIRVARNLGLVDLPGVRKVHSMPIPRVGGLAIALATLIGFAISVLLHRTKLSADIEYPPIITLLSSSVCVLILGLIDDLANIPARFKLLVLMAASAMFCGSGGVIRDIVVDKHILLHLDVFAAWSLTILWIASVTVSVNFIDGLDGLAAGITAIAAAVVAFIAAMGYPLSFHVPILLLAVALLGALLGFLVFNYHPAKVFMGDCGSMFIGFILAGTCVIQNHTVGTIHALILPGMVLAIPALDAMLTLVRRGILQRRSIFSAERGHIHHRLLDVGLAHQHVVLLLYAVTLSGAAVVMVSVLGNRWATSVAAMVYVMVLVLLFRMAGSVRARDTVSAIRRNRAIRRDSRRYRAAFDEMQLHFRTVSGFNSWWEQACKAAELLEFAKMDLPLARRDNTTTTLRWRRNADQLADCNSITAEIPIPQRRMGQTLRVQVEVLVHEYLESAGQRVALFSRLMGECGLAHLPENPTARPADQPPLPDDLAVPADEAVDPDVHEAPRQMPAPPTDAGPFPNLRVAIVHDFLYTYAGAERVLEQLVNLFPRADLFALFDFLPDDIRGFIRNKPVQTTFIQKMPMARKRHRSYLALMPLAIEQLDVTAYDLVISSSYLVAKGIRTRPDQLHVCYCHTPARFAWDLQNQYLVQKGLIKGIKSFAARALLHYIRNWDVRASNLVDVFATNSMFVGRRIRKVYRRPAFTIYPPVDTEWFSLHETKEDFYLTASRLVPYKRVDLIVDAFNRMPERRLIVIGEGPEMEAIKAKAGPNVKMLGYQEAERLRDYMQRARAFVFAAEEDFGIVPVEAMACGTPVIAYGRGGVTETVIHGQTGLHFKDQTAESLMAAVHDFEDHQWDPQVIRRNAERFSVALFREKFTRLVRSVRFASQRLDHLNSDEGTVDSTIHSWTQQADFTSPSSLESLTAESMKEAGDS